MTSGHRWVRIDRRWQETLTLLRVAHTNNRTRSRLGAKILAQGLMRLCGVHGPYGATENVHSDLTGPSARMRQIAMGHAESKGEREKTKTRPVCDDDAGSMLRNLVVIRRRHRSTLGPLGRMERSKVQCGW